MRIAHIAPLQYPTPPLDYGGIEAFLHTLIERQVAEGHDVTLFGTGDSTTSARIVPIVAESLEGALGRGDAVERSHYHNSAMVAAIERAAEFELIHSHVGCLRVPFAKLSPTPMVHTLHERLTVDDLWTITSANDAHLIAISTDQIADVPTARRARIPIIHHGVPFRRSLPAGRAPEYLLFVGRMSPTKNPLDAIRVAQATGYPIVLAGQANTGYEQEAAYFREVIAPLVDGRNVVHVGKVDRRQKEDLLRAALALIFPVSWREPFGLVMIEAMEAGVPVLAYRRGSVPEVVDEGVTGYYADSFDDLVALVPATLSLDRRRLRTHAARRFDDVSMAKRYTAAYNEVLRFSERDQRYTAVRHSGRPPGSPARGPRRVRR